MFACRLSPGQALRQLGTNIYDLSPAMAAGQSSNSCFIQGKVLNVRSGKITVLRLLSTRFYMVPAGNPLSMDSRGLLGYAAASRMSAQPLSPGQVFALSPEMRQYVQTVEETQEITIAHYPNPCRPGQTLDTYAVPLGPPASCTAWDYGALVYAPITNIDRIIQVYPNGGMRWVNIRSRTASATTNSLPAASHRQ
jgi:hypothetical protein